MNRVRLIRWPKILSEKTMWSNLTVHTIYSYIDYSEQQVLENEIFFNIRSKKGSPVHQDQQNKTRRM